MPTEYYLPLGIVTDADQSGSEELSTGTRSNVQKKLFEQLFGGNGDELITDYEYTTIYGVQDDSNFKPNYTLTTTSDVAYMDYSIDVTDKQTLYFDCFDKLSNSLSEDINESFMVTVNGQVKQMDYPSQSSNGLLKLGEFENEHVNVRVTLKKTSQAAVPMAFSGFTTMFLKRHLSRHRPPVLQTVTASFQEA